MMITALFSVLVSDGTHERRGWEQQPPHLNSLNKTYYSEAHKTKVTPYMTSLIIEASVTSYVDSTGLPTKDETSETTVQNF